MEFSQYVLDAIATVNSFEKDDNFYAASLIKGAAEKADSEEDSHVLSIIGGAMTMACRNKGREFTHFLELEGSRSMDPSDLSQEDVEILRHAISVTESLWLRTRFAHLVWTITKEYEYGQIAVTGYLDSFQRLFDPEHWSRCYEKVEVAYYIASVLGKKNELFKQVRSSILQKLTDMNGTDPLFLSIQLMQLVLSGLEKEELFKYVKIAETLFRKNSEPDNDNSHLADDSFSLLEAFYNRMNKDVKEIKERYAGYYETQARKLASKKDYFRAVMNMKKACSLYAGVDRDKTVGLRLEMEEWQKLSLKALHPITMKIDTQKIADAVDLMFAEVTLSEAIVQFGRISTIYNVEEIKRELIQKKNNQIFSSMWGSGLLNEQGQLVQELPPISDIEEESDAFRKHMVRHVAEERRMIDSIPVRLAFQHLRRVGSISKEELDFLVQDNAIIPANRADIIREGLWLALNGSLYASMHILLPQTENIFRHLVKMCGDTVTFLREDGSEEYKPLSALFKSDKLLECYDENLIFSFQSIMDDPAGENLRNLNGHGLLEPDIGNGSGSLYFLSMLIKLLSLYSVKAYSISHNLYRKEARETELNK